MHLRLHEIVEAGDSVISFDTYLADEVLGTDKESECCWWLQAAHHKTSWRVWHIFGWARTLAKS